MRNIDKSAKIILAPHGFVLKGNSWYKVTDDFIQMMNFQKSYYSNKYFLNIGIDIRSSDNLYQPEYKFPLRLRVENIISDQNMLQALDFDNSLADEERYDLLKTIILSGMEFLCSISSWKQLKSSMEDHSHPLHKSFITGAFVQLLQDK